MSTNLAAPNENLLKKRILISPISDLEIAFSSLEDFLVVKFVVRITRPVREELPKGFLAFECRISTVEHTF